MVQLKKGVLQYPQNTFLTNKWIPNDTDVRHGIHPFHLPLIENEIKARYEYSKVWNRI